MMDLVLDSNCCNSLAGILSKEKTKAKSDVAGEDPDLGLFESQFHAEAVTWTKQTALFNHHIRNMS